jgi:hypothetical protein
MNKIRKEFSIGRKISPTRWNAAKGLSLGRTPEEKELNAHIATIQETFYKIERDLVGEGECVTTELLLERYNKVEEVPEPRITFFVAMDEHNEEMRLLKEKGHIARESYSRYLTTKKYLERYIKEKYDKSDLEFDELNLKFLKGFDTWLSVKTVCENNTVMKYLKSVKKIINFSIQQEYLSHNPFIGHKIILEPVSRNYLSKEELARIKNLVINNESLNLVRYIFLFAYYTGLSYCDLKKLTIHDFKTDNEGKQWIIKERDKTKVQSNIKVLKMTLKSSFLISASISSLKISSSFLVIICSSMFFIFKAEK